MPPLHDLDSVAHLDPGLGEIRPCVIDTPRVLNSWANSICPGRCSLGDDRAKPWHCAIMLLLALLFALLVVLAVMIITRRWTGRLASLATLIAGAIMALWLAQVGLLPGSTGPLTPDRPRVPGLDR